jgi:phage tail tape-measure protein
MYEFHGWVVLAETAEDIDEGALMPVVDELRTKLEALNWPTATARLEAHNGGWTMTLTGLVNRRRHEARDVDELLEFVGDSLRDSFGLVYDRGDYVW